MCIVKNQGPFRRALITESNAHPLCSCCVCGSAPDVYQLNPDTCRGGLQLHHINYYASRRSRSRDTVKLTVCVCVSVRPVTVQRLQCDEN